MMLRRSDFFTRSQTENYWDVYFDTTQAVKERLDAEGIVIPFPQHDVHMFQEK